MQSLVTGGNVSAEAMKEPQQRGAHVWVMARQQSDEGKLANVEVGVGDLREPGSFENEFYGRFT
ncbi:MAG: hypothetical protein ABSG69_08485 [Candidatus Acidiferrum sp.]